MTHTHAARRRAAAQPRAAKRSPGLVRAIGRRRRCRPKLRKPGRILYLPVAGCFLVSSLFGDYLQSIDVIVILALMRPNDVGAGV